MGATLQVQDLRLQTQNPRLYQSVLINPVGHWPMRLVACIGVETANDTSSSYPHPMSSQGALSRRRTAP